jgi:TRAP-type C4-dicarboxylate transport system permease small subunit
VDRLPPAGRRAAEAFATLAVIVMFGLLVVLGGRLVWDEYRFEVTSPGLGEPQWIYTLALPLLSAAVIGRAVGHLVRALRSRHEPRHDAIDPL